MIMLTNERGVCVYLYYTHYTPWQTSAWLHGKFEMGAIARQLRVQLVNNMCTNAPFDQCI